MDDPVFVLLIVLLIVFGIVINLLNREAVKYGILCSVVALFVMMMFGVNMTDKVCHSNFSTYSPDTDDINIGKKSMLGWPLTQRWLNPNSEDDVDPSNKRRGRRRRRGYRFGENNGGSGGSGDNGDSGEVSRDSYDQMDTLRPHPDEYSEEKGDFDGIKNKGYIPGYSDINLYNKDGADPNADLSREHSSSIMPNSSVAADDAAARYKMVDRGRENTVNSVNNGRLAIEPIYRKDLDENDYREWWNVDQELNGFKGF